MPPEDPGQLLIRRRSGQILIDTLSPRATPNN
jgi:hypothetical protein